MNKVVLIGNLTKNPDLTTTGTGISVCKFTLAVSRRFSNSEGVRETDFLPIIVWRTQAEHCNKYLRKGSKAAVSGTIQTRNYEANDGTRRYITEIIADEVKFLSTRNEVVTDDAITTPESHTKSDKANSKNVFDDLKAVDENLPF